MTDQEESVNQSQSTQYVSQMTPGNTKKGNMTRWLVNLDTGPGLTFSESAGLAFGYEWNHIRDIKFDC